MHLLVSSNHLVQNFQTPNIVFAKFISIINIHCNCNNKYNPVFQFHILVTMVNSRLPIVGPISLPFVISLSWFRFCEICRNFHALVLQCRLIMLVMFIICVIFWLSIWHVKCHWFIMYMYHHTYNLWLVKFH